MQFSAQFILTTLLASTPLLTFGLPAPAAGAEIETREPHPNEHIWERNILEGRVVPSRGSRAGKAKGPSKPHALPCAHMACLNDGYCVDRGCQYCDGDTNYCAE